MATSVGGAEGIELISIKQEMVTEDDEEREQSNPDNRLSDLLVRIEVRETILKRAWSSLTQALSEYKTELKLVSEDNDDPRSKPDSVSLPGCGKKEVGDMTINTSDTTLDRDAGTSNDRIVDTLENERLVLREPAEQDSVPRNLSTKHKDMVNEYSVMKSLNQHLENQLKDCRSELKERDLDLMSKVVQLGLVEAKLSDSKKRCSVLSHHVKSLLTVQPSSNLTIDTSATNDGAADVNTNRTLHELPSIARESIPLSVEHLNSSNVFGMLQPLFSDSGDAVTPTHPRKRGRPPGRGRGSGRGPLTVSMMMRGMGKRQYSGRTISNVQYKPRYISEMIAAVEGTSQSPPLPGLRARGARSRGTNIPIRTLLHMNALGLDISDQATSTMDVSDRVNTLPPATATCTDQRSETSNGHVEEEKKMDPFSDLYIDPANIKTEPVDSVQDTDALSDTVAMHDTDTTAAHDAEYQGTTEEKRVRRSSRAAKRKIYHSDSGYD